MFSLARIESTAMGGRQRQGLSYSQTTADTGPQDTLRIPPEVIDALYLRQQVEEITSSLGSLATTQTFPSEEPSGQYLEPFKPVPSYATHQSRHREVVTMAIGIINILQGPPGELSIQYGAWDMVNLAIRLHELEMYSDAETIGSWTVDLYRTLVRTNARVFEPYLALALRNLSRYRTEINDDKGAIGAIEECVMLERAMSKKPSIHKVHLELSISLIEWWGIVAKDGQMEKCLGIAEESLAILDDIRAELAEWEPWVSGSTDDEPFFTETAVDSESADEDLPTFSPLNSIQGWDNVSTLQLDYNTAQACHNLSCSLEDAGRIPEAHARELQALSIFRDLSKRHPGIFDVNLAQCLMHLSRTPLSNDLAPSVVMGHVQECIQFYRELSKTRSAKITRALIECLWDYSTLLYDTGDIDVALKYSAEAMDLIRRSNTDRLLLAEALQQSSWSLRHLKQNEMVVSIRREVVEIYRDISASPTTQLETMAIASRLLDLAHDHIRADQVDDAVSICKEAVDHYRSIRSSDDSDVAHTYNLARGLSCLTHTLNIAEKLDQALVTGAEALNLYRRLIVNDSSLIQQFLIALQRTTFSARYAKEQHAIKIHAEIIEDFRALTVDHPEHAKWRLADAFGDHDFILCKHRQMHEAFLNSEELVKYLRGMPLEGSDVARGLMTALRTHAGSHTELGHWREALTLSEEAIVIGKRFIVEDDSPEMALALADTLDMYSEGLRNGGRYDEALAASEEAMSIYRRHPRDDTTLVAYRICDHALNLRHAKRLPEALVLAEEAVEMCRLSTSKTLFARVRIPYVLETFSMFLAEAGDGETASHTIQQAVKLYRNIKSNPTITEPWSYAETLYPNALVTLSSQFATDGNWEEAAKAMSEAMAIYKGLVVFALGYYPRLARALDLKSLHLCAAGRHEEAMVAAKDLVDRQRRLDAIDPELSMLVGVALDDLRTMSSQLVLREQHLQCPECSGSR
jgi:tetratricopeptide (TPR) repeat protein